MLRKNYLFAIAFVLFLFATGCDQKTKQETKNENAFTFAFLTDIHLQPERGAIDGYKLAIKKVNELNPDFVITGGDLIMDALGQNYERSDSLYNLYTELTKDFEMPVYNTIGNHEIFGLYEESKVDTTHELYREKMYEDRIGPRYYTFEKQGWKFFVLDAIGYTKERKYIGKIDQEQIKWITTELEKTSKEIPIAISVHIPFITVGTQIMYGSLEANSPGAVITNAKELLDLFQEHNLKLVLQGHLHILEDIYIKGIHFITGGAVSAKWWSGPHHGLEEGFILFTINKDKQEIEWKYIDYGWEVPGQQ